MCSPAVRNCFIHDQNSHSLQHVFTDLPVCMVRAICLWHTGYLWLYGIIYFERLQTKKMKGTGQVHSQIGEVEEQGGKLFVQHYTESPCQSRNGNSCYRPLLQFPLLEREQCYCSSWACTHIFILLHTHKCIFQGYHCSGLYHPHITYI